MFDKPIAARRLHESNGVGGTDLAELDDLGVFEIVVLVLLVLILENKAEDDEESFS